MIGRLRRRGPCGEAGTTLMELMVGMVIMTIFLGMFTTVVVMMNSAENKAEAVNTTATQLNQAFLTLDKAVRQAAAISTPGTGTSGDWYVELRTTNTGAQVCTQLRVDINSQQLQKRTWYPPAAPSPAFTQVTAGITNGTAAVGASDQPFVLQATSATVPFQQLVINLTAQTGATSRQATSKSSFTIGAVNSTVPVPTAPICTEGGRP